MTDLKPRSVPAVVLYDGDDQEELALLKRKADHAVNSLAAANAAAARTNARRGGDADMTKLQAAASAATAAFNAFVDQAAERAVEVRVRPIGRTPFRELMKAHPPRMVTSDPDGEGRTREIVHEDDAGYEVNVDTFPMALMSYADGDVRTLVTPAFDTAEALQKFLDSELNEGDFDQAWITAYTINRNPSADPSRFRYSVESQSSTETDA